MFSKLRHGAIATLGGGTDQQPHGRGSECCEQKKTGSQSFHWNGHVGRGLEGIFRQKTPSSGRTKWLVSSHLSETLKLLVQHARDHVDFLVVELLEQRGCFVVADKCLPVFVFVHENAQRNEEAHAVILFE